MKILCINPATNEEAYFPFDQLALANYPVLGETQGDKIINIRSRAYENSDEYTRVHNNIDIYNHHGWNIDSVADFAEFMRLCER